MKGLLDPKWVITHRWRTTALKEEGNWWRITKLHFKIRTDGIKLWQHSFPYIFWGTCIPKCLSCAGGCFWSQLSPQSMCAQWAAHTHAFHMNSLWEWKRKKTAASILKLDTFLFKNNHANHKGWQLCPWLSTKSYLQVMGRIQENVCGFHANTFVPVDIRTWNWCVGLGIHELLEPIPQRYQDKCV